MNLQDGVGQLRDVSNPTGQSTTSESRNLNTGGSQVLHFEFYVVTVRVRVLQIDYDLVILDQIRT